MGEKDNVRDFAKRWGRILFLVIAFKAAYFLVLITVIRIVPEHFNRERQETIIENWFPLLSNTPVRPERSVDLHFQTWDAAHYLYLSEHGYSPGLKSSAFYPLWPLLVRWFSHLTAGSHVIAGVILANLLSLAGWTLFYEIVRRRFGPTVAGWALALLIAFPGSLFYQFIYSESLFFYLIMLLWLGLERKHYGIACLAAFLLPLTRAVGVFVILPIAWHYLSRYRAGRTAASAVPPSSLPGVSEPIQAPQTVRVSSASSSRPGARWAQPRRLSYPDMSLLLAPPLGLGLYFALMWHWTGNPLEGIEAQKYWGAHSISNLWNVPKFIAGFFEVSQWHGFRGSVLDRCMFALLLYSLPVIWRLGKDLMVWSYVLAILPAMSGTFVSFTRFESTAFPLFIALAVFFTERKSRWPVALFASAMFLLQILLVWRFVNYYWAG